MTQGKVVLITGASGGLGIEIVSRLSEEGYRVYGGVRDVTAAPLGCHPLALDLTDHTQIENAVAQVMDREGKIDALIHNAGIAFYCPVDSMTLEEARRMFEVNFFGAFRLTQLVLPGMRDRKEGRLIFVSSVRAVAICPYMGMYSASKAALEAIAYDWRLSLEPWNIKVSVVQPGPMNTGITLQHGSYFSEPDNPYLPYKEGVIPKVQRADEAAEVIAGTLRHPDPGFRVQPDPATRAMISRCLCDPSGIQAW